MVYKYYRTKEESRAEGKPSGSDTLRTNAPKQKGKLMSLRRITTMLYPSIWNASLFDDLMNFDFPMLRTIDDTDRKLYGKNASRMMKTDVHEQDDHYEVDIDLPGFKKDEINLDLENGYLTVHAAKALDKEEKDHRGKLIRQERYSGSMERSFYVGDNVTEEEIKAKFEDGVLKLNVPKKDAPKLPEKKTICIEG